MITTIFGEMDENVMDSITTIIVDSEDETVEHIEYRLKKALSHEGADHPVGTLVYDFNQVRKKRVNTIFGFKMDVDALDKHIEVIDNENELTQCPEYRLREERVHDGIIYPAGTLVHRSAHVQLKKSVVAEGAAAMFG